MYAKYFVLFAILFTGWFLRRINFIDDKMNRSINKLIVYFAYPCLIVHNIGTMEMSGELVVQWFTALALFTGMFFLYGGITYAYAKARKFPAELSGTAELSMVLPNNGFMGLPVALIFFGEPGMLLMLAHNSAFNIFCFTYGMHALRRNRKMPKQGKALQAMKVILKLLVNPNILALIIGFAISLPGLPIPDPVDEYLLYIGSVSTPMAMIYIGSSLSKYNLKEILKNKLAIESSLMKLIWLPAITVGILYLLPVSPLIKCVGVLGAAFPTAATASMLSEQEDQSPGTASQILFLSTMASLVTIPLALKLIGFLF